MTTKEKIKMSDSTEYKSSYVYKNQFAVNSLAKTSDLQTKMSALVIKHSYPFTSAYQTMLEERETFKLSKQICIDKETPLVIQKGKGSYITSYAESYKSIQELQKKQIEEIIPTFKEEFFQLAEEFAKEQKFNPIEKQNFFKKYEDFIIEAKDDEIKNFILKGGTGVGFNEFMIETMEIEFQYTKY
jgi:hypothetical protein